MLQPMPQPVDHKFTHIPEKGWCWFKEEFDPSRVGVLLTSHPRQQMFWDECLPSWNDSPFYVIMGYDDVDADKIWPHMKKWPGIKEVFVTGGRLGHVKGELGQLKVGFQKLYDMGFIYAFKLASDIRVDNPMGIEKLWHAMETNVLGDYAGGVKAQILGNQTSWIFGFSGILATMMRIFHTGLRIGSAEGFFNKAWRRMNVVSIPERDLHGRIGGETVFNTLKAVHVQGKYCRENKVSIPQTWEIGEIWK